MYCKYRNKNSDACRIHAPVFMGTVTKIHLNTCKKCGTKWEVDEVEWGANY